MDWLQWITSGGVVAAFGLALATYLRMRPAMKQVELQGEAALWTEIASLRTELKRERELCEERIDRIEERHSSELAAISERHSGELAAVNAELQVQRHDRNNVRQALTSMFAMLKQEGADVVSVVATVEEMLKSGDQVIAVERAAIPALKGRTR